MSIKSTFGLDGFELGIHALVTAIVLGFTATFNRPDEARSFAALTLVGSLVLLSIRRSLALRRVETKGLTTGEMAAEAQQREARLELVRVPAPEDDRRVGPLHPLAIRSVQVHGRVELEAGQARMAELEERLDFAERLLARPPEQRTLQPDRES